MFGSIGITELIILAGIALVVLGPEKFPEFAKIAARTFRDMKGYLAEAQRDLAREMKPVKDEFDKISRVDAEKYINKLADDALEDEKPYNPEPEGPTVDNTFQYGSYGTPEDQSSTPKPEPAPEASPHPERLDG